MTGPAWAPLRPGFRDRGAARRATALIALGSGDVLGALPRAIAAVLAGTELEVDVVTAGDVDAEGLAAVARDRRVRWHRGLPAEALADLMATSRVAAVSASQLALEAAACALPFVAIRTVANQDRVARGLRRLGAPVLEVDELDGLPAALKAAAAGPAPRVDGGGAARLAARVRELAITVEPRLRPARWADADLLLDWANEPATRAASFRPDPIARDGHLAWLAGQLIDPDARVFIAEDADGALGTVRLLRQGGAATVSIAVAPARRGRGAGTRMLAALSAWTAAARFAQQLDAWVREDNHASLALFARAGYDLVGTGPVAGRPARRFRRRVA